MNPSQAVIVSAARTPFARSWRGAFNLTHGATLGSWAASAAMERAALGPAEIDDVMMGCANPEGANGFNIGRQVAIRSGCPTSVPGVTVNRFCSSGLQAIAWAAQRIVAGECEVLLAGGLESISCVQNEMNRHMLEDQWIRRVKPELYWPMLRTAETVATRYHISRQAQDEYGVESQRRAAAAQEAGRLDAEIIPVTALAARSDSRTGRVGTLEITVRRDETIRPDTTLEGVMNVRPALPGGTVTAATASPFCDGAAACVVMSEREAGRRGLAPLAVFRGFAVAGCEPDEMGIGPIYAVPKLLRRHGLAIEDIDLWELNEAFAVQVLYCRDILGIPQERLNVDGGAIALGHPYGASGARMVAHLLMEGRRRKVRWGVVTMCVGGGQGAAGLLEIL